MSRGDIMDKQSIIDNLSRRLRTECEKHDLTLERLCKRSGISPALIYNMRNGYLPSLDKITALAEYCCVSVDYLIGFEINTK